MEAGNSTFEWAKTDGSLAVHPAYTAPAGYGLWVPTPPAFAPPANPYGGTLRSFIPNLLGRVTVPEPVAYSEDVTSEFYQMNKFLYDKSLVLTPDEISIGKTWGDIPGNYNGPSHFTNIVTQLVVKENTDLFETALLYAKHGLAMFDAGIVVFKAKYQYNGLRPITYIRNTLKINNWNSLIPTPPHPEYLAAHAVIAQACAEVLEDKFGHDYSFSDHTHEAAYGTRFYSSFDACGREAAWSRSLAGIHYVPTAEASLKVGKQIGRLTNCLKLKLYNFDKQLPDQGN